MMLSAICYLLSAICILMRAFCLSFPHKSSGIGIVSILFYRAPAESGKPKRQSKLRLLSAIQSLELFPTPTQINKAKPMRLHYTITPLMCDVDDDLKPIKNIQQRFLLVR